MREIRAIEFQAYRRDAVVKCYVGAARRPNDELPKRGDVKEFSARSRGRLLFSAFNASCDWYAFAVLTYPNEFPNDGVKVKRDIKVLCQWMVEKYGVKFLWGIEFQERGAPHVNLLIDKYIPKGLLAIRWFQIVGSGDFNHLKAGTRIEECQSGDQAAGYMAAAYSAKKSAQKTVPPGFENVGRFWGISRGLVKPSLVEIRLADRDSISKVRSLRKFTEKQVKSRRCQPMVKDNLRSRKVKRKPTLQHLHAGLSGFKSYNGSSLVSRLLSDS